MFSPNCEIMPAGACYSLGKTSSKRSKKENEIKDVFRNINKTSTPKQYSSRESTSKEKISFCSEESTTSKEKSTYPSSKNTLCKEKNTYLSEESTPSKEKSTYSSEESTPSREMNTISSEESTSQISDSFNNTSNKFPERKQLSVKPQCTCSKCNFWTENKTWDIKTEFEPENECKIISRYNHSLFKKNDGENVYKIFSLDYNAYKKMVKRSQQLVLVHR